MILCAQTSKAAGDETFTTSTKYNFAGSGFNASDCVKTNKNLEDSAFKLQSFGKYQSKVLLPWSANYKTPMSLLLSKELCLTAAWGISLTFLQFQLCHILSFNSASTCWHFLY